jgi:hypothetical protein
MSSSNSNMFMYIGVGVFILTVALVLAYFFLTCRSGSVKVAGKCYKLVEQDASTATTGVNEAKIHDKNMTTGAATTTATTTYNLKIKDTTKIVKGARITAKVNGTSETEKVQLKITAGTNSLMFDFPKNGKTISEGKLFSTALTTAVQNLTLEVPTGVTVYEVELI